MHYSILQYITVHYTYFSALQYITVHNTVCLLATQTQHMSTQTNKMVDIATMTIEAAETEEAIGSTDESDSQDQEFQVCVCVCMCVCVVQSYCI